MKRICKQCGAEFELSESEIQFYKSKNLSLPKRCKQCRNQNKQQTPSYNNYNNNGYSNNSYGNDNSNYGNNSYYNGNNNYSYNSYCNRNTANNSFYQNNIKKKKLKKRFVIPTALICIFFVILFGISQLQEISYQKYIYNTPPTSISENTNLTTEIPTDEPTEQITEHVTGQQTEAENNTPEPPIIHSYTFRNYDFLNDHYEKHGIEMGFASADDYLSAANNVINNPNSLHKIQMEDGDDVYYLQASNDFVVVSTDGYIRTYFRPENGIDYFDKQ